MNFSLAWRDCWQELQITRLSQAFSGAALKLVHMKRILASVKRSGVKQSWYLFSFFPSVKHQYTKCNASSQPVVSKALTVKLRWVPWLGTQTRDSKWIANQCYLNVEISRSMIQVDPDFRIYLLPKCWIFHFVAFRYVFNNISKVSFCILECFYESKKEIRKKMFVLQVRRPEQSPRE